MIKPRLCIIMMKRSFFNIVMMFSCLSGVSAVPMQNVKFHNEASDTIRITEVLLKVQQEIPSGSAQSRVESFGKQFLNLPYKGGTLDSGTGEEALVVDMEEFDCTTYVETMLALAYTLGENRTSWRDFIYNLERLRYRNGSVNGYASRLHYASDWVVDNVHRGNLKEVTDQIAETTHQIKTLDFMTSNRDKYPALKDDATYRKMTDVERGYRSHRYPYIKSTKTGSKDVVNNLRNGDVVLIVTKTPGLDVQHMGIVTFVDGLPHLMHASSAAGKIIVDKNPLSEYLRRNRSALGIRVLRLAD